MAYADYYLCNVCGGKTFYDANLNYEQDGICGDTTLDRVGQMAAICNTCAKTHHVEIRRNDGTLLPKWDGSIITDAARAATTEEG